MPGNNTLLLEYIQKTFPISTNKAEEIAARFTEKIIRKNDYFLVEGKICKEFCFLETGFAWSSTHDIKGNNITTNFYSDKQVVCELFSFFKQIPSKENFQAITDCHIWCITFDELQIAFHSMPEFREFGRSMLVSAYADLKQRMLSMLHNTAEERYSLLIEHSPDIFQNAPLKNIASYLGVTNTSLSRIRKEFAKKI
ncbi:Crp/Fnr family transcriptional regulator [Ferruginibacter lapsinanis]|uniref:Crp/Fnr family transcriptional regulator n=1 Tax=Ferruginibacter lapsinanis TaxID=563172 RepID=UPI001E3BF5AA|nr:Crp/Fnr family transcriptional regulator [Ferruginibacter lapsinanis]UEG49936.1 Crp/Fnr family transcriptional regulator [Ferruginibacter lapsinanis]